MPKKIAECSKAHLISVPLPNHAATYTVISHQFVIDYAYQSLANAGFGIVDEEYRCTADGQIAQGIYKLQFNNDPELSMMFAWTNSYNKQVKFKCLIGAYINQTGTVMTSGEIGTWTRKHVGTADKETKDTIDDQIANAYMYYNQLVSDKNTMAGITLNKRKQAQLLGVLFAEYQILTTEQASIVRSQMDRPTHVYEDSNSLWAFYNYVTIALQHSHPRTWMEDQRILHYFISTIGNFQQQAVSAPVVQSINTVSEDTEEIVDPLYAYPGQTNILDQIAEAEADLQADQIDEDIKYAANEDTEVPFDIDEDDDAVLGSLLVPIEDMGPEIDSAGFTIEDREISPENSEDIFPQDATVVYTDQAGNTFEAPIVDKTFTEELSEAIDEKFITDAEDVVWGNTTTVDTVDLNETTKMAVIVVEEPTSPCAAHDAETEKEEEKIISLEPTPEERALIEAEIAEDYVPWKTDEDNANLDLVEPQVNKTSNVELDDFDLDFASDDAGESGDDNSPDFF